MDVAVTTGLIKFRVKEFTQMEDQGICPAKQGKEGREETTG